MNDLIIEKVWAMPNGRTFTIKPIKEFVEVEVNRGGALLIPLPMIASTELSQTI